MIKRIKTFWESLEDLTTVSRRELFLEVVCCLLAGFALGILFSPKKTTIIGCNNGNSHWDEDLEEVEE